MGGYLFPREAQELSAMRQFQKSKLKTSGVFLFFLSKEKKKKSEMLKSPGRVAVQLHIKHPLPSVCESAA